MKQVERLSYSQWQKRNTQLFKSLAKTEQKKAREEGYHNVSWNKVKNSWNILLELTSDETVLSDQNNKVVSLFEHKLNQGNLVGAINLSIIEADDAKKIAQAAIKEIEENQARLNKLADNALAKYTLL